MRTEAPWLLIDHGNTAIKWRIADPNGLGIKGGVVEDAETLRGCVAQLSWGAIGLSSVGSDEKHKGLNEMLSEISNAPIFSAKAEDTCLGLRNSYAEPERLGVDRWLAMLAARDGFDGALCVVDAGTAVTVDIVTAEGQHAGGYILPGPELMHRTLTADTGRIRADAEVTPSLAPGRSTTDCVNAGVWRAAYAGVQSVLADHPAHQAVLTGGGAEGLLALGMVADHRADLVMEGLRVRLSKALDDSIR